MADYIKRSDALELAREYYTPALREEAVPVKAIRNIPSADVSEVKHGEWKLKYEQNGWSEEPCAECSECGEDFILGEMDMDDIRNLFLYCPNCGADMRGRT